MADGYYIDSNGNLRKKNDDVPNPAVPVFGATWAGTANPAPVSTGELPPGVDPSAYPYDPDTEGVTGFYVNPGDVAFTGMFPHPQTGELGYGRFTWRDLKDYGWIPSYPTTDQEAAEMKAGIQHRLATGGQTTREVFDTGLSSDSGSGGGGGGGGRGGGGGTAAAPVYIAPNREEVAESLKSYVVATTGRNDSELLGQAVDAYMKADKSDWELRISGKAGEQSSPLMAAKEIVRASDAYRTIHQLRPDSVDEMDWVTQPQSKLRQLGISAARAEGLGIAQAQAGSTDQELMKAADVDSFQNNRILSDRNRDALKQQISNVARLIK